MSRRSVAVNGGLSVALAASGVAGYLCIGSPVAAQAGTSRTATVTRGTVTATVSASGNAASTSTVGLSFGSAGTLTELDVKPGQTVRKGAVLAKIDPAGAQQSLRSAQAQLASAQAQLTAAGTGQTAAAASKDAIAVQQAQQTVSNAGSSVTQATAQRALDAKQQDQIVAAARLAAATSAATSAAPSAAAAPSTRASGQLVPSDQRPGAAPTAGVSPGTGGAGTGGAGTGGAGTAGGTGSTGTAAASTGARSGGSSGGATSGGGASSLDVVTAAEQTRDQTALRDAQSVTNAQQQLASAKLQLAAQQATATADAAGPAASGVATAQASVDSATSAVQTAQQTVDETVLHAPSAGTVVSVAGAVGEQISSSTGGTAAGSGGSGTGGSGTTGSGGGGGGAASNSTGSAGSAGTSGFLVLTDLTSMQVTTNVAEADAASVQDGQSASITFSASGATATGRVTAVAVNGTTSNNVVNYPVTVTLTRVPKGVRPGATASVVITTSTATDVLELPTAAITSLGSRHTVTLVKGTTRQVTPIEVGVAGGTTTEVTGGLSESDTVELPTTTPSTTTGGLPGFGGAGLGGLGGGGAGRRGGGG